MMAQADALRYKQDLLNAPGSSPKKVSKGRNAPQVLPSGEKKPGKVSGYLVFCNENRAKVVSENQIAKYQDVLKILGTQWNALTETNKNHYSMLANQHNSGLLQIPTTAAKKTT